MMAAMKITRLAFLLAMVTAFGLLAKDGASKSPPWNLPGAAYGQIRMVPSKVIRHVAEVKEWQGPWEQFSSFAVELDFSEGHQISPRDFHFVDPVVGLKGWRPQTNESHSRSVRLFDRESTSKDVVVEYHPLPETPQLDSEYLAATISGEDSLVTWNVYVRFTAQKPAYVREAVERAAK